MIADRGRVPKWAAHQLPLFHCVQLVVEQHGAGEADLPERDKRAPYAGGNQRGVHALVPNDVANHPHGG